MYLSAAEGVTATSAREGLLALDSKFDVSALQDALKQAKAEGMDIESILKGDYRGDLFSLFWLFMLFLPLLPVVWGLCYGVMSN